MTQNLFHIHSVISCALQKGWHTGMYLASAPPRVFGGQGIAYNVSGVCLEAALHKTQLAIVACAACLYCDETETI
jgi:hypothetical protein